MDISTKKEELSICYISALCTQAGISYDTIRHDDTSTDGLIQKRIMLTEKIGYDTHLRVQLKSTSSDSMYKDDGSVISYVLKVKNYNDMCQRSTTPIILALLVLPEDEGSWVKLTDEELLIKGRMYWAEFSTYTPSNNKSSVTVNIDKQNHLTPESLQTILEKIAQEDWP